MGFLMVFRKKAKELAKVVKLTKRLLSRHFIVLTLRYVIKFFLIKIILIYF